MLLQGWQMRRKLTGEESPETGESLNNLGMFLLFNASGADDLSLAVKTLEKSLEVSKKVYGEENPETAMLVTNLAMAYILLDRYDDAEKELKQAMPVTLRVMGPKHPDRAYQLTSMGRILQEETHYDEAEKAFTEAVAINEAVYGKNHPNVASSLKYLAGFTRRRGMRSSRKRWRSGSRSSARRGFKGGRVKTQNAGRKHWERCCATAKRGPQTRLWRLSMADGFATAAGGIIRRLMAEAYTVLARRYRSQTFDELVGQEAIAQTLKNAIRSNRVANAFLFTGTRGWKTFCGTHSGEGDQLPQSQR